ncbi:MAG: YceH family protein [Bryobacteraceae bacterium]
MLSPFLFLPQRASPFVLFSTRHGQSPRQFAMVTTVDPLTPEQIRVLGSLIEKEITTPEYYPLTLNALVNACNQKSSREPVVSYDESTVHDALAGLRAAALAGRVSGAGHRVEKYGHSLGERLNLGRRETAILCVLMLRGAQTVGELRGRTERMYEFSDMAEVESVLDSLATRTPDPLVSPAARGRWVQLLGGTAAVEAASAALHAVPALTSERHPLEERVEELERQVEELKSLFETFRRQFE